MSAIPLAASGNEPRRGAFCSVDRSDGPPTAAPPSGSGVAARAIACATARVSHGSSKRGRPCALSRLPGFSMLRPLASPRGAACNPRAARRYQRFRRRHGAPLPSARLAIRPSGRGPGQAMVGWPAPPVPLFGGGCISPRKRRPCGARPRNAVCRVLRACSAGDPRVLPLAHLKSRGIVRRTTRKHRSYAGSCARGAARRGRQTRR